MHILREVVALDLPFTVSSSTNSETKMPSEVTVELQKSLFICRDPCHPCAAIRSGETLSLPT